MERAPNDGLPEFKPVALYYDDADFVEYVLTDSPCVYKRIDDMLTVALDMHSRQPIGFRLKGFKNYFLQKIRPDLDKFGGISFVQLTGVLLNRVQEVGDALFADEIKKTAYKSAIEISKNAVLEELPQPARAA